MRCSTCGRDSGPDDLHCTGCGNPLRTEPLPHALPTGTVLRDGAYLVIQVLAQGGFGITYQCIDNQLKTVVAVKEFFPRGCARGGSRVVPTGGWTRAAFEDGRNRFLEEARTLARFEHAGIVRVFGAFEDNGTAYFVMEYLRGHTLEALLAQHGAPFEEPVVLGWVERVGDALQRVHGASLLHRDLKPSNIIVTDDGRVVLIDFGTAREYASDLSQSHSTVLTAGYAPLEQYSRHGVRAPSTDVYALAATTWHLLSGAAPPAATDRAVGISLPRLPPTVSPATAQALTAALSMDPLQRPQSVPAFLAALPSSAHDGLTIAPPPLPPPAEGSFQPAVAVAAGAPAFPQSAVAARPAPWPVQPPPPTILSPPRAIAAPQLAAPNPPSNAWKVVLGVVLVAVCLLLAIPLLDQTCSVSVTTVPAGAEVVVDGQTVGAAPVTFKRPRGDHEIEVRRAGFFPHKERFSLEGRSREFKYSLHPEVVKVTSAGGGDYATLTDAVAQSPSGTTIRLGEGAHRLTAPLRVSKTLTIEGQGMNKTRVASSTGTLVYVESPGNIQLRNMSLACDGSQASSVLYLEGATAVLESCEVSGARTDEKVENGGCGIFANNASLTLRKCVVQRNQAHGVQLQAGTLNATACDFNHNRMAGCALYGSAGGTVSNCSTSDNVFGLLASDTSAPTFTGNRCVSNSDAGILCRKTSKAAVSDNSCTRNGAGIQSVDSAQATLRKNDCRSNRVGIIYFGDSSGVAESNTCASNRSHGIELQGSAHPELRSNVCMDNETDGLAFFDNSSGRAVSNVSERNQVGVYIARDAHPNIEGTTFSGNRYHDTYHQGFESTVASADEGSPAVQKLREETGLELKVPAGIREEVKEDGEIQFTEGNSLFVAIATADDLDSAMQDSLDRMKKIDTDMKAPETKDMEEDGVKAKAARGTVKIEGKEMQWMVLAFDGGRKVMRMVLMGEDVQKNKTAEDMVNSIRKR